jgi:hypothetical protein
VSVKVVVEIDPPKAAVVAVVLVVSEMAWNVKLVPPPIIAFWIGLPEPVERSYH